MASQVHESDSVTTREQNILAVLQRTSFINGMSGFMLGISLAIQCPAIAKEIFDFMADQGRDGLVLTSSADALVTMIKQDIESNRR